MAFYSAITNTEYKAATEAGRKKLKGLLGYLRYRRDVVDGQTSDDDTRYWVDRGLGATVKTVYDTCTVLESKHVVAFTTVISPNTDCMTLIDPEQHPQFVGELTELSIDAFFEMRDEPLPEYSYIFHRRDTEDPTAPGRANPHAHVILAGTYEAPLMGERQPFYMNKKKSADHFEMLSQAAKLSMNGLMERYVGRDWQERVEQIIADRERATQLMTEQAVQVELDALYELSESATTQPERLAPDCWGELHDGHLLRGWVVTRKDDNHHHWVGIYWQADDLLADFDDAFEPLLTDLDTDEAEKRRKLLIKAAQDEPENALETIREIAEILQPEYSELSLDDIDKPQFDQSDDWYPSL